MAKIYTKTGDKGQTGLVGGQKVSKTDPRIHAYGTVDELNSCIGFVRSELTRITKTQKLASIESFTSLNADLETIQHWLFDLGSLLAAVAGDREKYKLVPITETRIQWMEQKIDAATAVLKPLREFVLPAGSESSTRMHLARTVARRAERAMMEMTDLPELAIPFINRLSDYLFVMARLCNHLEGQTDVPWKKV